jgi:endonuclease III
MPNFTDKARRLDRIRLVLRRRYGQPAAVVVTHPVEHALRAVLSEEATPDQVDQAVERIRRHFVDLNDLRVSRPREIRDVLGTNFPRSGHKARVIPRLLDQVFKQHNSMVWDFLEKMGKVETRAYFEKLEDVRPFVAAVIARDCAEAHTVPVDNDVARVLGRLGILDPGTQSESGMQAFLERAVKASRAYEVHALLKRFAADVCLVGTPRCAACPLAAGCCSPVRGGRGRVKKGQARASKSRPKKAAAGAAKKKKRR